MKLKIKYANVPDNHFNKTQLRMGIKDEMEHVYLRSQAKAIAKGHLVQNPRYYTLLKKARL